MAVTVCVPLAKPDVVHVTSYGPGESAAASAAPSTRNTTLTTPISSDAVAASVTLPLTVAPGAGLVSATAGAVVSFDTVTTAALVVVVWPAASRATAVTPCAPLPAAVVFHNTSKG